MTSGLWKLLAARWPLRVPHDHLARELGVEAVDAAVRVGAARTIAVNGDDPWPCPTGVARACARRVVDEGRLLAVCAQFPPQCDDEPICEPSLVIVDDATLPLALQRALSLPTLPAQPLRGAWHLGSGRLGVHGVDWILVPRPSQWAPEPAAPDPGHRDPNRVSVAVTFTRAAIPIAPVRRLDGGPLLWLALEDAWPALTAPIDLADVALRLPPSWALASALWPRFDLVVDGDNGRFLYGGRPLDLDRNPIAGRLLARLAAQPGAWVARAALQVDLWPDDFGGRRSPDLIALDRRLRQARSVLTAAFEHHGAARGLPLDPVENLRTRGDADGGYRLAILPERVHRL